MTIESRRQQLAESRALRAAAWSIAALRDPRSNRTERAEAFDVLERELRDAGHLATYSAPDGKLSLPRPSGQGFARD